ncbi:MAG: hypothetical protein E7190_00350 [Erysipelotrichaceae bacterium]|nr:hypothetical protein [Erysipelotrichaceae bacterium]
MDRFNFTPANGFLDASDYPDPENESEAREQLFSLHKQTRDFINNNLVAHGVTSDGVTNIKATEAGFSYSTDGENFILISDAEGQHGTGDMKASVYDKNANGIVDDAETVNGHTINDDIPAGLVSQVNADHERIDNILVQGTPTEGNAELIDIRVGADGETYTTAGSAVRSQFEEFRNCALKTVEGRNMVISNAVSDGIFHQQRYSADLIVSANNEKNLITKTVLSTTSGLEFYNMAKGCVRVTGTATTSNLINRYLRGGSFSGSASTKEVYEVSTGDDYVLSVAAFFNRNVGCETVYAALYKDNGSGGVTTLRRLSIDASSTNTVGGAASAVISVAAGEKLYIAIGCAGDAGRIIDAEMYVFLSHSSNDAINVLNNPSNLAKIKLYKNTDTLVASNAWQGLGVEYLSRPIPDGLGKEFDVCEYNVGHFALGDNTPIGTDDDYKPFVNIFAEEKRSIFGFVEWDEYWNEAQGVTSESMFGSLRPYWSSLNIADGYILQRIASQHRILYEYIHYFDNYYPETWKKLYFVDCVLNNREGDNVHFIVTHLSWRTRTVRKNQIDEILAYLDDINPKYYVIMGDFNNGCDDEDPPETWEEFEAIVEADLAEFTDWGAISLQGSMFGDIKRNLWIHTYHSTSEVRPIKPYDNILISPNMVFLSGYIPLANEDGTVDVEPSDHYPLHATIAFK